MIRLLFNITKANICVCQEFEDDDFLFVLEFENITSRFSFKIEESIAKELLLLIKRDLNSKNGISDPILDDYSKDRIINDIR